MNETRTGHWPIARIAKEVHEVNIKNGWFEEDRSWGMTKALLHSEISEMLEAYRDHEFRVPYVITESHLTNLRLMSEENEDAFMAQRRFREFHRAYFESGDKPESFVFGDSERMALARVGVLKPEGFGSELADVFIRWCDTVTRLDMISEDFQTEVSKYAFDPDDVGAAIDRLHDSVSLIDQISEVRMSSLLSMIFSVADCFDVKLEDEYKFKIAYNRTRGHKHGGKLA